MKPLETAEKQLRNKLEKEGWVVTHKGWPDFVCVKDSEMMFVEVKGYRGDKLKKEQHYVLTNLSKLGLNCFRWDPNSGFEQILPTTPAPEIRKSNQKPRLTWEEKLALRPPERQKEILDDKAKGIIWFL